MDSSKKSDTDAQSVVEYALILVLIAILVIAVISIFGGRVGAVFSSIHDSLVNLGQGTNSSEISAMTGDFLNRIEEYYATNHKWPRSWAPYAYTDIGLTAADWSGPVNGIYWGPNGSKVGLANRAGDNLEVYVNDLAGNQRHLVNGWNIWCVADTRVCYYHTVAAGNEVDINTIVVVEE